LLSWAIWARSIRSPFHARLAIRLTIYSSAGLRGFKLSLLELIV
jgi:hypothetical protein